MPRIVPPSIAQVVQPGTTIEFVGSVVSGIIWARTAVEVVKKLAIDPAHKQTAKKFTGSNDGSESPSTLCAQRKEDPP